jgi:DNA polymerase-1
MPTTLLVDGDILVYQHGAGHETVVDWGDGTITASANIDLATADCDQQIERLKEQSGADKVIIALSDPKANFRKSIYADYKRPRASLRKPLLYGPMREYLQSPKFRTFMKTALEADDVLGILSTHPDIIPGRKVIWSIDKDLLTVPGFHLRDGEVIEVPLAQANRKFYSQILTGDRIDNFPGCPGVGPKKAEAILAPIKRAADAWPAVVAAFEKAGKSAEDALVQARLARILRHTDYDYKRKEPILWQPPSA